MIPVCFYAFFAEGHVDGSSRHGCISYTNVYTNYDLTSDAQPNEYGIIGHEMTLYVMLMADEGRHIITIGHEGGEGVANLEFEIRPEHRNLYPVAIPSEYPILAEPGLNQYPVLLDGVPLTKVYLLSRTQS